MIQNSLEQKLSVIYTAVLIVFIMITLFAINSINRANEAITNISDNLNPIVKSVNESLISLNTASNSIAFSIPRDDLSDLNEVQKLEASFNKAVIKYNVFTHALLLGSESQEFQTLHAGLLYSQWQNFGLEDNLIVPAISGDQRETLQESTALFNDFVQKTQKAFALKKKLLRLKINDPLEQYDVVNEELEVLIFDIQSIVSSITNGMQSLVFQSENLINQNAISLKSSERLVRNTVIFLGIIAVMALSLSMLYLRKAVITPILQLVHIVEKIISSGFSEKIKVEVKSKDEIGKLADAFNAMIFRLKQTYATLEEKVEEKTIELGEKVGELEKMNKLMVGREIRMIELKKEIENIKAHKIRKNDFKKKQ